MPHLAFKEKMPKATFEQTVISKIGVEGLTASPYNEEGRDGKQTRMTLYYKNNVHVGTWQGGTGWMFKSALQGATNAS